MKWRIATGLLWAVAGWYAGSMFAALFQLGPFIGPLLAVPGPALVALGAFITHRSAVHDRRRRLTPEELAAGVGQAQPLETTGA